MEEANNPVGRLLGYMEKALEIPGETSTHDAWATIIGCGPKDSRSMVRGLSMLMDLCESAEEAIRKYIPGDQTLFLPPFERINRILSNHMPNTQWQGCKQMLDATTMTALKFGNYSLGLAYPAAKEEISTRIVEFIEKLDALLAECLDSDLTNEIKNLFIHHLEAIRKSLLDYRVGAPTQLEVVVDQAVGAMHRHLTAIQEQPVGALETAKKVFSAVATANEVITFTQNALLLAAPVTAVLLPHLS